MSGEKLPERIRDYYEDPYHRGRCDFPTHFGESQNEEFGDVVAVELRVVGDSVVEIWFDGEGSEISQGAASIFAEHFEGKSVSEIMSTPNEQALQIAGLTEPAERALLGFRSILLALEQPIMDDDSHDATFSGPDLGDEC